MESKFHEVPQDLGTLTQWDDGCRFVQPSKCCGVYFDRLAGCVYELGEMVLTCEELSNLVKLMNQAAGLELKNVVLYHEDNSILASINDGANTWDLTDDRPL